MPMRSMDQGRVAVGLQNYISSWETGLYRCNQPGHQSIVGGNQVTVSIVGGKPRKSYPLLDHTP